MVAVCPLRREPVMTALGARAGECDARVHLAVMREPWLSHVMAGRKTIESRFSRALVAPHGVVETGDLLLFKRAAGPVCATARVAEVGFHDLAREGLDAIRARFGAELCADEAFWSERGDARYATLMHLRDVRTVSDLYVEKRDRRGWVVLEDGPHIHADQLQLDGLAAPHPRRQRLEPVLAGEPKLGQLVLPGVLAA
jgi:hypothetical protein